MVGADVFFPGVNVVITVPELPGSEYVSATHFLLFAGSAYFFGTTNNVVIRYHFATYNVRPTHYIVPLIVGATYLLFVEFSHYVPRTNYLVLAYLLVESPYFHEATYDDLPADQHGTQYFPAYDIL